MNIRSSTEFLLFASLLVTVASQKRCPADTIRGPDNQPIKWPNTISSNAKVASDCIDSSKQLLTRKCDIAWIPNSLDTASQCAYYRESYAAYGKCPPDYIESRTVDICYQKIMAQPWIDRCLTTGASSLSFLDLHTDEQFSILQELNADQSNVGLPARNTIGSGKIDNTTVDVELEWRLPAIFGSILKLSNGSFEVICNGNLCTETCLSMNISGSTVEKPFALTLDNCDDIGSVLCVSRKNSFIRNMGCSKEDYYRVGYSTNIRKCYSIKMFVDPLTIDKFGTTNPEKVVPSLCLGSKIFQMDSPESLLIYRQLVSAVNMEPHQRCLFGMAPLSSVITYIDWARINHSAIQFTNWDKSVDFSTVESRSNSYLTVNSMGEWRWEGSATCIVCAADDTLDTPTLSELVLQFTSIDSKLVLNVNGSENLWRDDDAQRGFLCFARIANRYVEVHVESTSNNDSFLLRSAGSGSYWCSGHLIQTIDPVRSRDVIAFGMIFVIVLYNCVDLGNCDQPVALGRDEFEIFLSSLIASDPLKIDDVWRIRVVILRSLYHVMISVERNLNSSEVNEIRLSTYERNTYLILKILRRLPPALDGILLAGSKEFCLPNSLAIQKLNWRVAKVGQTIELLKWDYITFTRLCSSNEWDGAVWNDYEIEVREIHRRSSISQTLIVIHNNFRYTEEIPEVLSNLSIVLRNATLNEADVFIISEIFGKFSRFMITELSNCDLKKLFGIYNDVMLISPVVAASTSSLMNSTNSLLASLDEILFNQAQNMSERSHKGVISTRTKLIVNYILDPIVSGFSGIAFLDKGLPADKGFHSYAVEFLSPNQPLDSILLNDSVVLASFVPQALIKTWKSPKIIITLFFNDILFQSDRKQPKPDGNIISLSILNSNSKFSHSIPFFFKANTSLHSRYKSAQVCGHWSLSGSKWDGSGCLLNERSLQNTDKILCECSHLTHFSNLINTELKFGDKDEMVLNLITLIGCALSLAGVMGIFLTAIIFRKWRRKSSSKFLLQLSAAIAAHMILMIITNFNDNVLITISGNLYGCIAIGALIHYSMLVMFFWMLIVAYLQFLRYVIVFKQMETANFLLRSSIFGWGMPILPVFIVIVINPASYIPDEDSNTQFCYPSGRGLWFGLYLPIISIVIANMTVFIAVVVSLVKCSGASKFNKRNQAIWSQLRLSVFLFFVLGLTWIFGFMSHSVVFSYLFCLTATLQGLVLFFYFVILDPVARNLWKRLLTKICCYRT